jgi:acyl dehydratase
MIMKDYYFEDFEKGLVIELGGVTFTESQIIDFALHYDPQPFHINREAAAQSAMGGLVASGFHTLAFSFRLFIDQGWLRACSIGGAGLSEVRWIRPVRPGDTMRGRVTVIDSRPLPTSTERGMARFMFDMINQAGEPVLSYVAAVILQRRPK